MTDQPIHVISLGAGVQSTTMLLMALAGEITPMPDAAIFADTGWERRATYRHLDWLEQTSGSIIPIHRVRKHDLRADVLAYAHGESKRGWRIPAYFANLQGRESMLRRQCTTDYKVEVINRWLREHGATNHQPAIVWIGISLNEVGRMKPSREAYTRRCWPLVERRMTRWDCELWLQRHGYPLPPRSACIGCPYRTDDEWREIKADPDEWADAVEVDAAIRCLPFDPDTPVFLHRQLVPLPIVDLTTRQERGQLNLWDTECEGMCGV